MSRTTPSLSHRMTLLERITMVLLAIYAAFIAYFILAAPLSYRPSPLVTPLATVALFAFAVLHAGLMLGWPHALTFLLISFLVSLAFESVGVLTGVIYGPYYYTNRLGWKIFGLVPLLIPLAWFMMIYPAYVLVNLISSGHPITWLKPGNGARGGAGLAWTVWLAFLSAMAMTTWDLTMDVHMVMSGNWAWTRGGAYFGIPVRNFVGWLATTFTVYLLYRLVEWRWPARGAGSEGSDALRSTLYADLPVLAYALTWLGEFLGAALGDRRVFALVAFFGMGTFVFLAAAVLLRRALGQGETTWTSA